MILITYQYICLTHFYIVHSFLRKYLNHFNINFIIFQYLHDIIDDYKGKEMQIKHFLYLIRSKNQTLQQVIIISLFLLIELEKVASSIPHIFLIFILPYGV